MISPIVIVKTFQTDKFSNGFEKSSPIGLDPRYYFGIVACNK